MDTLGAFRDVPHTGISMAKDGWDAVTVRTDVPVVVLTVGVRPALYRKGEIACFCVAVSGSLGQLGVVFTKLSVHIAIRDCNGPRASTRERPQRLHGDRITREIEHNEHRCEQEREDDAKLKRRHPALIELPHHCTMRTYIASVGVIDDGHRC